LHFAKTEPVPPALTQYTEIAVTPATGALVVTTFIIGVDCGKIINPRQLDRCMKGGVVMGLREALKEEVTFDMGTVTSTDWNN
jgi:nicotinate dehydrogenase subunit B